MTSLRRALTAMTVTIPSAAVCAPRVSHVSRGRLSATRRAVRVRAGDERGETTAQKESREVLDAFFIGKALAETLLERAGGAFADALSEVSRFDAENREQIRAFQDEVIGKAREDSQRTKRKDDGMR